MKIHRHHLAAALSATSVTLCLALGAAPPALAAATPAPSAATTTQDGRSGDTTLLVDGWYSDFLHHMATGDPGSQYWIDQLATTARPTVLTQLLTTREYVSDRVSACYEVFLGRDPAGDPGAQHWIDGVLTGSFPLEWVEQNVLASSEYAARAPGSQAAPVVARWYRDILGRSPDPGEVAYWAARLPTAGSLQVVREMWYSPEAVDRRTQDCYGTYLRRQASPGELAYWHQGEMASDIGVQIRIASSQEYYDIIGGYV